jgi:molybdopterin-guanine dinucleotide biosynthesis protein A
MPVEPVTGDRTARVQVAGVILAGGRSRRMGGETKALLPLAGKPMLKHVIDRVKPQVAELSLSVEYPSDFFHGFGLQQLPDRKADGGPLQGLLAALQWMGPDFDWLLLVPCDAPFVPADLAQQLYESAVEAGLAGALVRYGDEIQPTFSLWHRSILPILEQAVTERELSGFKQFLREVRLAERKWPLSTRSPFFNINNQDALREAGRLINENKENPHA